jgi:hypothetical protein
MKECIFVWGGTLIRIRERPKGGYSIERKVKRGRTWNLLTRNPGHCHLYDLILKDARRERLLP